MKTIFGIIEYIFDRISMNVDIDHRSKPTTGLAHVTLLREPQGRNPARHFLHISRKTFKKLFLMNTFQAYGNNHNTHNNSVRRISLSYVDVQRKSIIGKEYTILSKLSQYYGCGAYKSYKTYTTLNIHLRITMHQYLFKYGSIYLAVCVRRD